ncbi:MAG: hypothetical protein QOF02_212 [Blastocatellia bacterium]|jgi:hypothetical protein|nr:hypothetical protein [Blastocatellia bacterium]
MKFNLNKSIRLLAAAALILCSISLASAQKGTTFTRRVQFPRGRTTVVLKGKANWGASYVYRLRAEAGQTMLVHITGVPTFSIIAPRSRNFDALDGADNVQDWTGELPRTGDYQIVVGHANDNYTLAPYTLEVTIR